MKLSIKTMSFLLGNSERTVQRWKDENRLIIKFLLLFSESEIDEFCATGEIERLKQIEHIDFLEEFVNEIHTNIVNQKIIGIEKYNIGVFLVDFILEFIVQYPAYPNEIFEDYLNFVLAYNFTKMTNNKDEQNLRRILIEIFYQIDKKTFYIYAHNINLVKKHEPELR